MRAGSADAITKMEQQNNLTKTILSVFVLLLVMFLFRALVLLWSICGKSQCSLYIPCCCGRPAEEIISKLSEHEEKHAHHDRHRHHRDHHHHHHHHHYHLRGVNEDATDVIENET